MRKILTGIEIGSDTIKIITLEELKDKFVVLACTKSNSTGVSRGLIVEEKLVTRSLSNALKKHSKALGYPIDKAIMVLPVNNAKYKITDGYINMYGEVVEKKDINYLISNLDLNISSKEMVVNVVPLVYKLDGHKTKDPLGKTCEKLEARAIISTTKKAYLYRFLNVFANCNIEPVGMTFGLLGDYIEAADDDIDKKFGAVIDISEDIISVGVVNRGIMIKSATLKQGSRNVDKEISLNYRINKDQARFLKENFASASSRLASPDECYTLTTIDNGTILVNMLDLSRIIENKLEDLLKSAMQIAMDLTNKKISYIIVTGGISTLEGFNYLLDKTLGVDARLMDIKEVGARNNCYSSVLGAIKYFALKNKKKDINYSMINDEELELLMSTKYEA